ncbi:MAG TPA: hypothetical protein VFX98_12915 [Longimicrobiaceae bacterium]|nr:hypothetical protein [Longimicrobiaceae bacterium]
MPVTITDYACSRCGLTWPYYRSRPLGYVPVGLIAATTLVVAAAAVWSALLARF